MEIHIKDGAGIFLLHVKVQNSTGPLILLFALSMDRTGSTLSVEKVPKGQ